MKHREHKITHYYLRKNIKIAYSFRDTRYGPRNSNCGKECLVTNFNNKEKILARATAKNETEAKYLALSNLYFNIQKNEVIIYPLDELIFY